MLTKVDDILAKYNELSEHEKITLFLELQKLDMREHYDPLNRTYRVQMFNIFGKTIVDRSMFGYNKRQINRELHYFTMLRGIHDYDPIWAEAGFSDKKKQLQYQNTACNKLLITEL